MIGLTLHETDTSTNRSIALVAGWNLFGYSSATPINVTHLNFTNSTAVVNWTKAVSQGKVLAYFYYRDNNVYRYSATPDLSMQDYALRQNRSYWTKIIEVCNSSQPCNISMPGVGGSLAGQSYEWNKLRFSNGSLELNITEADNATYNWIFMSGDSVFHYWDGGDRTVCGTASCDDDTLYPWDKGYWIWVNQNNIQILRRN